MSPARLLALLCALLLSAAARADEAPSIAEQQRAILAIAAEPSADADTKVLTLFDRLEAHDLPSSLWLELLEVAARLPGAAVKTRLAAYEKVAAESRDPLRRFRECLEGGNAARGRELFLKDPRAGCVRCHRVAGEGAEVGPDLTSVRQVTDRVFILESIVEPNAVVTNGFPHVLLKLASGEEVSGIAGYETSAEVVLTSIVDGKKRRIAVRDIVERTPLPTAMPPGFGQILGKRAVRDLVEFLATVE